MTKYDIPESVGHEKIISLERAIEYVKNNYPELNADNVIAEVVYDAEIQLGYLIPCYKLYVETEKMTKDGFTEYTTIYIPMIETGKYGG
jgi:hypothetical protein